MSTTKNLGIELTDSDQKLFGEWWREINANSNSAMQIIDDAFGDAVVSDGGAEIKIDNTLAADKNVLEFIDEDGDDINDLMRVSIYDPQGKCTDIYAYIDKVVAQAVAAALGG